MSQQTSPDITAKRAPSRFSKGRLRVGTFGGYPVFLHWSLLLLAGLLLVYGPEETAGVLLFLVSIFLTVLVHEGAHGLTAKYLGFGKGSITLLIAGGFFIPYEIDTPPYLMDKSMRRRYLFAILAGPLSNFAFAIVCYLFYLPTLSSWLLALAQLNISLAVLNILPVYPLDGGQIVTTIASQYFKPLAIYSIFLILLTGIFLAFIFIPGLWTMDSFLVEGLIKVIPIGIIALLIQVVKSNEEISNDWLKVVREEREAVEGE